MKNAVRHVPMNGEKCLNMIPVYYVTSGINMFLDVVIYLLPMPVVIKLYSFLPQRAWMKLLLISVL